MIQLERGYLLQNKQNSFSLKAVCNTSFLSSLPFSLVAFVLHYFDHFLTPTFVPTFPSRPSRPSFPSIKDKKICAVREFHEA